MAQFFYTVLFTVMLLFANQLLEGAQLTGMCLEPQKLLSAENVVSLFQHHNLGSIMMHEPDPDLVGAFKGTGITVNLVIPNRHLQAISSSHSAARRWVASHITPFSKAVKFRYVAAGDEGHHGGEEDNHDYDSHLAYGAMLNVHRALTSFGLEKSITVSTVVSTKSLSWNPSHPSRAAFSESAVQADMVRIVNLLSRNDAPLLVHVFPYFVHDGGHKEGQAPLPYALMSSDADSVKDGEFEYRNLFDAMVDSMYAALDKAGAPNVKVVAETGWPIAGRSEAASPENANIYTENLIDRMSSGTGTPMRPWLQMEAYLHTLLVQEQDGVQFGMLYHNKTAAYGIPSMHASIESVL